MPSQRGTDLLLKGKEMAAVPETNADPVARYRGTTSSRAAPLLPPGLKRGAYLSSGSVYIIEYLCSSGQFPANDMGV
jgi:hypothetical protein